MEWTSCFRRSGYVKINWCALHCSFLLFFHSHLPSLGYDIVFQRIMSASGFCLVYSSFNYYDNICSHQHKVYLGKDCMALANNL